jgi:galactokinase
MRDLVRAAFVDLTGHSPSLEVRAPGRVNLIGDHTDYNDGFVLPAAIEPATWFAAAPRSDRLVRLHSIEHGGGEFDLDALRPGDGWVDYAAGTIWALDDREIPGFDAVLGTQIPVGAGLSSSAAFEMGIARIAFELTDRPWDPVAAARAGQKAENDFVGMPCGIMDQLIVASATAGSATLIDCRSLECIPCRVPGEAAVVILDTATRRRLVDSAYEDRRQACQRVASALGIAALRDATLDMIAGHDLDPVDRRRAVHVVTENARVQAMAAALEAGNPAEAGRLMNESHASLRDDYEVSGPALDTITDLAHRAPGCWGARMTGAGFAGCAVALVDRAALVSFSEAVGSGYLQETGRPSALHATDPSQGVALL